MSSREELQRAIAILDMKNDMYAQDWVNYYGELEVEKACKTAKAALRSELDRVDGCSNCDNNAKTLDGRPLHNETRQILDGNKYCYNCGHRLKEDNYE